MEIKSIQDILPLVTQPSRYLGTEINTIHKNSKNVKLHFLFAFPDLYEIGSSHFGIQILYNILNSEKSIFAERVFSPAEDLSKLLKLYNIPLSSLETGKPIRQFDIIGFSLLYELNYTNVLEMLYLGQIPFKASDRGESFPIIIAGGPCTANPEPVADFFDAIVIGDGEEVLLQMANVFIEWKENCEKKKIELLKKWSNITGIYIPSFYKAFYDSNGFQHTMCQEKSLSVVHRAIVEDLDSAPFPEKPIIPYGKTVHDRLRLEVSRGCSRGCRFCQAGMIYRPVRERCMKTLMRLTDLSLLSTGYEDLSLLSLSTSDYGCIGLLIEKLIKRVENEHIAISFPSFRAGTLSSDLMALIKKVRKTGFTIAPEAGSQRLRNIINKNISENDILSTVEDAFRLGWKVIKLYFMIGLPTETEQDIVEIVNLVNKILKITDTKGKNGKINVSVNTFIPKPHTPFQWASQISLKDSQNKIEWLKEKLKHKRVKFKWQNPESSLIEGLFSRGDRRLSGLLEIAHNYGCRFDGWSDQFNFERWKSAADQSCIDLDFYTHRSRCLEEVLPWDHINVRIKKEFFKLEWEKSKKEVKTEDCRYGDCQKCGVCDFKIISPKIYKRENEDPNKSGTIRECNNSYLTYRFFYKKTGKARFFGHLEQISIFLRALKRCGIKIKYSEGFHPMPKISFDDPLPLGMESLEESFCLKVIESIDIKEIKVKINEQLPNGFEIFEIKLEKEKKKLNENIVINYKISLNYGIFEKDKLNNFENENKMIKIIDKIKGCEINFEMKSVIKHIEIISSQNLLLSIYKNKIKNIRPNLIISQIFKIEEEHIKNSIVTKIGIENN